MAASPTEVIVIEAIRKGSTPPINIPTSTFGLESSRENDGSAADIVSTKAAIMAKAASAAAPIAKPFPMAAVVFTT